jgi:hypothetical protein
MASVAPDAAHAPARLALGVEPGAIVAKFGVHRRQITFDAVDTVTGEIWRGQIASTPDIGKPAGLYESDRGAVRSPDRSVSTRLAPRERARRNPGAIRVHAR